MPSWLATVQQQMHTTLPLQLRTESRSSPSNGSAMEEAGAKPREQYINAHGNEYASQ